VTVRRALKQLVGEGLIEAIPSHGYRKVKTPPRVGVVGPVAYVLAVAEPDQVWDFTHEQILSAFSRKLMEQGRQTLAIGCKGRPAPDVFRELKEAGASGVVLDTSQPDFVAASLAAGLPFVVVDAHSDLPDADVVMQDNFNGARLAAGYLVARGHKRIAWIGPTRGLPHYRERFAGAQAALAEAGLDFVPESLTALSQHDAIGPAEAFIARLLQSPDRPTALVCMWQVLALAAVRVMRRAGLTPGKDVELAAWGTERDYRQMLAPEFLGGDVPATAVWRPEEMAELALARLELRTQHPAAPPCRTDVKVRLLEPRRAEDVLKNET
jgi:LacI family transcriptional regulator